MRKSLVLFIVSLAFVFLLLVVLFFWGHRIHRQSAVKLLQATNTLMMDNPSIHLMDSALFTLNDAENNFRLYTALYERKYLQNFSAELGNVLSMVDTISYSLNSNDQQFKKLIKEKEAVSANIATLKEATDSMLAGSLKNDKIDQLLRRIPAYHVSEEKEAYDAMQLREVVTAMNAYYKNILREQLTDRLKLNEEEASLADNNIAMMEQLKLLLVSLRENAARQHNVTRQSAHHTATSSIFNMKSMMLAELIALLLSIAIIVTGIYVVRKKNQQLERAKQVAEEQTKTRTDFLNNMSHEMRTPLTSVAGFTEQLGHTPLNPEQKKMLSSIESATNMLVQVVNDVLDFSKLENDYISFTPQSFVLYQVYIDVVTMMQVQVVKKNLELQVGFEGDKNGQVKGDIFRLKQILINLISNAIRYTDKGSISVMATLTDQGSATSLFGFTVTDTGEGISTEAQQHLFERFFQAGATRSNTKGTGLGLAITKRLINLQGGEITVKSELHRGSTFTCGIPYEKVSLPLMIKGQQDIQELTGAFMEGRYILIADDQEMNLLLLKLILTRWKCRFDMATDGISAMELFNQYNYDLVLLDQHMPGLSGIEVARQIRQDKDPVKAGVICLALTANISAEDEAAFRQVGFNGWLMKPFKEKEIYQEIMKYLPVER